MILADSSYASTMSGYVITALLTICIVGGGYVVKQLANALANLTAEVVNLKEKVNQNVTQVAIMQDRETRSNR